jgi:ATP-dependent Clp protease protease subunit
MGDKGEMEKAIEMLEGVKDSIINAYEIKTGLSRARLSHLMDAETWMDAHKAVELGFADEILQRAVAAVTVVEEDDDDEDEAADGTEQKKKPAAAMLFSRKAVNAALINKLQHKAQATDTPAPAQPKERSVKDIMDHLNDIKKFI